MPAPIRNTVDRLDKPSAYYLGRVRVPSLSATAPANAVPPQNKKRKYRDEPIGRETTPEEPEDPLKDAATLYVGNLYV